ncbi:LutC/YkgG family protein [Paenibacillus sp. 1001270B_150601_E10]|uniref:LutC/YkgG family protein n=1 Tax=Paenibacillus sp. 1001270B_150601_E10 TaxID=2787079 RepID=UPI00189EDA19|nr:lactate utilization protein [Paenibacillus sp. 1001270B_150601_E10]
MTSHHEFLSKLEEESRKKQEAFFGHIADRLKRPRQMTPPPRVIKGAPTYWEAYERSEEERMDQFIKHWQLAGGHAHTFTSMSEAASFILELAEKTQAERLIMQEQAELLPIKQALEAHQSGGTSVNELQVTVWNTEHLDREGKAELVAQAAQADIGITAVHAAVSYTGSIVLTSSATTGRTVSLLPTMLIAIIPVSKLKTRLGEVLRPMDAWSRAERPAGIHFVSGPSRSADIENDLTIGVHGPGIVHALLIEEE